MRGYNINWEAFHNGDFEKCLSVIQPFVLHSIMEAMKDLLKIPPMVFCTIIVCGSLFMMQYAKEVKKTG